DEWMIPAYIAMFGVLYLIGQLPYFQDRKAIENGYMIIGAMGSMSLLITTSFHWFWEDLSRHEQGFNLLATQPEFWLLFGLLAIGATLLIWRKRQTGWWETKPLEVAFLLYALVFLLGFQLPNLARVLVNLMILATGILTVLEGARKDHLGYLNYGLLIITALVVSRFFDQDISFVLRGILFVFVGVSFFTANYLMIKKRNQHVA
ncbi:MAG: hypothetical protein AAGM67_01640, partial [Bacteroidota bacterium]